jgi:hypothetical protein
LNLTENRFSRKEAVRLRPNRDEGLTIQYHLKRKRFSFVNIGESLKKSPQTVANVVSGRRRSARIEAEIARILGKADWNEVVLEARSEVQKKPVAVIRRETLQAREARRKTAREALARSINEGMGETDAAGNRGRRQRGRA